MTETATLAAALSKVVETLPIPQGVGAIQYSLHDVLGSYLFVSQQIEEVLGYQPEDVLSDSASDMVHPDDVDVVADAFQMAIEEGLTMRMVVRSRQPDNNYRWIQTTFRAIHEKRRIMFAAAGRGYNHNGDEETAWFRVEPEAA